jgi:hypothetical protein
VFDSLIWDEDYWHSDCPDDHDGYALDTLDYWWDQSPGSNPAPGRYTSNTEQSSVYWQAPPCIGTVEIVLHVNDKPDNIDFACSGDSTRDDDPRDFHQTVNVVLPSDCEECSGDPPVILDVIYQESEPNNQCGECGIGCGVAGPPVNIHMVEDIMPCYEFCMWRFGVFAQANYCWGPCFSYYSHIANGTSPYLNEGNYCAIVDSFLSSTGCANVSGTIYSNTLCLWMHERYHYNDFQAKIATEELNLRGHPALADMIISCQDGSTTICQAAYSMREQAIIDAVEEAYLRASVCNEAGAQDYARPCFSAVADSICAHWDCGE